MFGLKVHGVHMVKSNSHGCAMGCPEALFMRPTFVFYANLVAACTECVSAVDFEMGVVSGFECSVVMVVAIDVVPV